MAPAGIGDSVEGVHAVAAAARAGRVRRLYVERGRAHDAELVAVVGDVEAHGGDVEYVDDVVPMATTSAPQGMVAAATPIPTMRLAELLDGPAPAVMALDHLQDPRNVGAIARSAAASGMTGLVVPTRRGAPLSATAFKAAAGALEVLPVAIVSSIPRALDSCRAGGLWIVGLDTTGDRSLFGLDLLSEPVALVIGAEGAGLSRLAREKADLVASIPMAGATESLNAATAASLACFEVMRARLP